MYGSENLIWLKNVKRKDGVGWAYEYKKCGETFFLNWPTKKKGSASTPKAGDIILLFQKPNEVSGKNNKHVHLTHLVSPVDEDVVPDLDHPDHLWCRKVKLIAIAAPIHAIPNPGYYSFFKPNRGLTNPIHNLTNNIGLTMAETQEDVFRLFHPFFCADLSAQLYLPKNPVGVYGEAEGDKIIRKHIIIEQIQRNSRIVEAKKNEALRVGNGKVLCECCDFDFLETYGVHGKDFIECHHKVFISKGSRITELADLALVCSNCHRMLHRKKNNTGYYSVEELRELIFKLKTK